MSLAAPIGKRLSTRGEISNRKIRRILSQLQRYPSLASRYRGVLSLGSDSELTSLLSPDFKSTSASNQFETDFDRNGARDDLSKMLRSDLEWYLPGDLLVKSDMATMANSLEVRSPLLDHEIVEWTAGLPSEFKIRGRQSKYLLKEIARSLVPAELIDRPKMGFAIPRADWLRGGLKIMTQDLLTDATARNRGWFDQMEVEKVLAHHMAGQDRDGLIWPMLMLELWARNWLDR